LRTSCKIRGCSIAIVGTGICWTSQTAMPARPALEKMKHHAHALRTNADEGEIEFVAWRDIPRPPRTWRGTMEKPRPAVVLWARNLRRDRNCWRRCENRGEFFMANLPSLKRRYLHRIEPFEYRKSASGRARQKGISKGREESRGSCPFGQD